MLKVPEDDNDLSPVSEEIVHATMKLMLRIVYVDKEMGFGVRTVSNIDKGILIFIFHYY